MSGISQRMENFISLKPVRLEDFRCTYNHSYPTPVQLVKHLYQLDHRLGNYAGGSFSHWLTRRSPILDDRESLETFPVPDWHMAGESSEDGDSLFPWLQSPTQPVPQVPHNPEDDEFLADMSDDDDTNASPLSPTLSEETEVGETLEEGGKRGRRKEKQQFTCPVCSKSYRMQASLDKHLKTPCEVRPYRCEICEKRFKRPDHLKAHSRMHTGERPFLCQKCGKSFRQKNHLQRHSERKHVNGKVAGDDGEDLDQDQNSSFDICGLSEELEGDELRSEDQD